MSAMQAIRAVGVAAVVVLGVVAAPASATFSGANGQITFFRFSDQNGAEIFRADADGSNVVQLTDSGDDHAAVESDWAPSGLRIAFDSDRLSESDGDVQIFTMDRDGGDVQQVTTGDGFHGDPAYAPSATQLAIEADLGNYPADEGIYIVPSTGGPYEVTPAMKVVGIPGNGVGVSEPQLSPDGGWISFTTFKNCDRFNERSHHPQPEGCTSAIYRVHPDGTGLRRLTEWGENASYSDWSPDGRWIAHDTGDNGKLGQHGGIWMMHPDGSDDHAVIRGTPSTSKQASFYNNPVFSPDGTSLAFTHFLTFDNQLERSAVDGTGITPTVVSPGEFQNRVDWGSAPED
jgi:Tol biopolymer transport system component